VPLARDNKDLYYIEFSNAEYIEFCQTKYIEQACLYIDKPVGYGLDRIANQIKTEQKVHGGSYSLRREENRHFIVVN